MSSRVIRRSLSSALSAIEAIQIEHQGHYSADRLAAFHAYTHTEFRMTRLITLVLTLPIPSIATVVLLEIAPLNAPSAGPNDNIVYWIRATLSTIIFTLSLLTQIDAAVPILQLSRLQLLVVTTIATVCSGAFSYAMAILIGFPVPFEMVLHGPIWLGSMCTSIAISSWDRIHSHPSARLLLRDWAMVSAISVSQLVVYPLYTFLFQMASPLQQSGLSMLLAGVKIAYRYLVGKAVRVQSDRKPEIVTFQAEISYALFVTFSLQSANSMWTIAILLGVDVVHCCFTLYDVLTTLARIKVLEIETKRVSGFPTAPIGAGSVVDNVKSILTRNQLEVAVTKKSPNAHEHFGLLCCTSSNGRVAPETTREEVSIWTSLTMVSSMASITPITIVSEDKPVAKTLPLAPSIAEIEYTKTVLRLLHLTEFAILAELVEFIAPAIYTLYVGVALHLPNRVFIPQLACIERHSFGPMLLKMMLYGLIELSSLFLLDWVLRRRLRFSPTAQLAMVLETQWRSIHAGLLMWVVFTVQTMLLHNGTDYSFKFAWLHK